MEPKRIALLGSGTVGRTLGEGFVRHGHEVVLGSRDPGSEHIAAWLAEVGERASAASYADAAGRAELVVMCVPGAVVEDTVALTGPDVLAGKVVIDPTNTMTSRDGRWTLMWGIDDSAGERIQAAAPEALVVKAFNVVGYQQMIDPQVPCPPPTMPICGDSAEAKAAVAELLRDVGWEPADCGGITVCGLLEAMCALWVMYGRNNGTWLHAFKIVHP